MYLFDTNVVSELRKGERADAGVLDLVRDLESRDARVYLSVVTLGELRRIVDLSNELDGKVFEPLKDPDLFATAHQRPVMRTVAWSNGADLAPEFLLDLLREQHDRSDDQRAERSEDRS